MTRLAPFALFAGTLAAAGLPIYIHAPKFYVDTYGVSLGALGAVLFGLRCLDVVQDPALGWLAARLSHRRAASVAVAGGVMALAMIGLFAVTPPVPPLLWFALTLALLFSSFSFLTITFYAQGVSTARTLPGDGHVRLAGWRETGALTGICAAAVAPMALGTVTGAPEAAFALLFALAAILAIRAMRPNWTLAQPTRTGGFQAILADPSARRLLVIALLNAAPVAVTSTLFLFFVDSRLAAPGWEGPLLLLFFISAAAAAPVWSRAAQIAGAKPVLMLGMVLSVTAFPGAAFLGPGDIVPFAVICLLSGAALGADMTLLPALFAARAAEVAPQAAEGFGLWSFVSKLSLALAAGVLLPVLGASGYQPGTPISDSAAATLSLLYGVVPLLLKLAALALLSLGDLGAVRHPTLNKV